MVTAAGVFGMSLAGVVVLGSHDSGRSGTAGSNKATLATFVRPWGGHDRLFAIRSSGTGVEKVRTFAAGPPSPYYATLTFDLLRVTGTRTVADARIRVTSIHNFNHTLPPIHVGELGTLRLRHGIVTDSLTRVDYCSGKSGASGICGL